MDIKIIGYIIAAVGIILIFLGTPNIVKVIPILSSLGTNVVKYMVIFGVIGVGVGIVLVMSQGSSGKKGVYGHKTKMGEEVPIFHGKEIVGYRIKKKNE